MSKCQIYKDLYKGENLEEICETYVDALKDKMIFIKDSHVAGIGMDVLERQIGLSHLDINYFTSNCIKEIDRIEGYRKYCKKQTDFSVGEIVQMMEDNEIEIVRKYVDGEDFGKITREIGIPLDRTAVRYFKNRMAEKGYFIDDRKSLYSITKDYVNGYKANDILNKYDKFKNENDFLDFVWLHQGLYKKEEDIKEELVGVLG